MKQALAIVLHDVAPATWRECETLLDMVAHIDSRAPVTLLVVPDFHHRGRIDDCQQWCGAIAARVQRGDELALHGYCHLDEAPPPTSLLGWIRRRVLTAREAEFSSLSRAEATQRMEQGLRLFTELNWKAAGFVAPAWQMSGGCRAALGDMPFEYTSTLRALYSLPDGSRHGVLSMSFSARSRWRRALSLAWNKALLAAQRNAPLVRVALHPEDALHSNTLQGWSELLTTLLRTRNPVTKGAWLREHRRRSLPGDTAEAADSFLRRPV